MKVKFIIPMLLMLLVLISCGQKEVYFNYQTIPNSEWNKDSLLRFDFRIVDKTIPYNFYIQLRHQGNYPYQNVWLFLDQKNPANIQKKDTVEAYLADQFGKWIGTGGGLKEVVILYQKQFQFPDTGTYHFSIRQGMRDSILAGIQDVGVRIEKAN